MSRQLNTGYIYILTNTLDDTFYIGSTSTSLEFRFKGHKGELGNTVRTSKLYTHYDKLGWDNVKISLLEEVKYRAPCELQMAEARHILQNIQKSNCLNMKVPLGADNWIYITPSTIINSPTEYIYYLYLHTGPMRKVFTEFKKYSKPYYTVIESFTRIRKARLLKQLRKVVPRVNKIAFESLGTAHKNSAVPIKTLPKNVPITIPTKNSLPIENNNPPKKRGRPKKEVPIKDTKPPPEVPIQVPMPPVPAKPRGKPKKVAVASKHDVIPFTAFAK
jgi:hypothetical protein